MDKLPNVGSLSSIELATQQFYRVSALRNRNFLSSILALATACSIGATIIVRDWPRLSIFDISFLVYAMFASIFLLRLVLRSHSVLNLLLSTNRDQLDPKSMIELELRVTADLSNWALLLAFSSVNACLLALLFALDGH